MDNIRLILIMALAFISLLLWEAWQKDYVLPTQQTAEAGSQTSTQESATDIPAESTADEATPAVPVVAEEISAATTTKQVPIHPSPGAYRD